MLQLSFIIRRNHPIIGALVLLMVSHRGANQAIGMDVLTSPTLVALPLEWAAGFDEIVFPIVLAGAFKLAQRGRGGVSLSGGAPAIIRGALGSNEGDSTGGRVGGQGLRWVKEEVVDVGVDTGMEQVPLSGDFLLPSVTKGAFSMGDILALDRFLHNGGTVVADLGYYADILEASESVVYQEMLGKVGVEAGEVVVLSRDSGGSTGAGMKDFSINPFRGVHTALDHRDTAVEDVADVGAGLGVTPLIKVADGVVVGVADIIFRPFTLNDALGVFLITFTFWGIFYCRHVAK